MRQLAVFSAAVAALALLNPTPARAQLATTTFVSGFGFDTNPCTVAAPCRSFQHAHDLTAAGGQITMLDAAGYGMVAIAKAISIVNDGGGEAGITEVTSGADAITINAGASDVVNLRGLTLNGVGTGRFGINLASAAALNIQDCVIRDFTNAGVAASVSATIAVTISDTIVSGNGVDGVSLNTSGSANMTTYLERVAAIGNRSHGIIIETGGTGHVQGSITDSVAIGNVTTGFFLAPGTGGSIALIKSKAIKTTSGTSVGLGAFSGVVYMSQVTLSGNFNGFAIGPTGTLKTFGDNYIIDATNTGTLAPISLE